MDSVENRIREALKNLEAEYELNKNSVNAFGLKCKIECIKEILGDK
jgi:hypothetical protein